jgi:2-C-methyl-D-erythritol 4-phosphate cytidylyltransferase/2-C-methyl-D-erythritol 2,4-cyclodiphosphate synthase
MRVIAAVLCAGSGTRFGGDKLAVSIGGKPVWLRSFEAFANHPLIDGVILVGRDENMDALASVQPLACISGGSRRQDSAIAALNACPLDAELLVVHDGARPFVDADTISRVVDAAGVYGAAAAAMPVTDTIKRLAPTGVETLDRASLRAMQTPQAVRLDLFREAAKLSGEFTDELSMLEALGTKVTLVDGSIENFKVTFREDIERARAKFGGPEVRTGFGYDVHRFATDPNRPLWLGGVRFDDEIGLEGHSDADVVLHAVTDAILGAIADGDIGVHFSNRDPRWKGAPSIEFVKFAVNRLTERGFAVRMLDITVVAERPKIMARARDIRNVIAQACSVDSSRISIKATTKEGLDDIGKGIGIESWCAATVYEF